jgi:hypothetical protein
VPPSHGGSQWFDPTTTHQIKKALMNSVLFFVQALATRFKKTYKFFSPTSYKSAAQLFSPALMRNGAL